MHEEGKDYRCSLAKQLSVNISYARHYCKICELLRHQSSSFLCNLGVNASYLGRRIAIAQAKSHSILYTSSLDF